MKKKIMDRNKLIIKLIQLIIIFILAIAIVILGIGKYKTINNISNTKTVTTK